VEEQPLVLVPPLLFASQARLGPLAYTVQQLHELSGVAEGEINGFEEDRWFPPFSALIALQSPLKCSVEWLLTGETPTVNPLYSPPSCDGTPLSSVETDLIAMFQLLNEHDRGCAFDIISMLYEQTTGNQVSAYSAYADSTNQAKAN